MRLVLLDYGVGNLFSLQRSFERLGVETQLRRDLPVPRPGFQGLVLPGVGNFGPVARRLRGQRHRLQRLLDHGMPALGICLGLQVLFAQSEEAPGRGLELLPGDVVKLRNAPRLPHMGWNTLAQRRDIPLLDGLDEPCWVYFAHSYYPRCRDANLVGATTTYGEAIPVVIGQDLLWGTQFHPEKSGPTGAHLLANFRDLCKR